MTAQQTIIAQENARLIALVAAFDSARETWSQAAETWDTDPTNAHADALTEAETLVRERSAELARHVASLVRTGYRLTLPEGKN